MKKILWLAALILLFTAAGVSAGQDGEKKDAQFGGNLVVATKGSPSHLDSDKSTIWTVSEIMNHVYEGLFEFDSAQKATPFLAESYTLANGNRTYAVTLRKGVLFHNSKEMTSTDVKASFDRWLRINGGGLMVAEHLEKAEVDGPYKISFTFDKPYAPFLNILASEVSCQKFYVRPKEIVEKYKDEIIREHIGTGVYRLAEFIPDQHVRLVRFDRYQPNPGTSSLFAGRRTAYIDTITVKFVKDPMVRVAGIQTGEFQFAEEILQDQVPMFASRPDLEIVDLENDMMSMLAINSGKYPFNNVLLRRALATALDMEELGRIAIGNEQFWSIKGGGSMFPSNSVWYVPDSGRGLHNKKDATAARELITKAGYDQTPIVIVNTKEDMVQSQAALGLKAQLEKAGFVVDVQLYDRATVYEKLFAKNPDWDLNVSNWMEASPDPQVFGAWVGTNRWTSHWDDKDSRQMDEIFERMMVETDFEKRYKIVEEWNKAVWEHLPIIKTFNYSRVHLKSKRLKGYYNFCKQTYWNTWLEN